MRSLRLLPIVCCWFLSLPLQADVFWRISSRADTALQQLGGTCVYSTDTLLNGTPGTLAAYSFDASAADVLDKLARLFGLPANAPFGGGLLTLAEKDRMRRLLVLPAAAGASACVALLFDQSLRDYARASREPPAWPENLPAIADATPLFSAVCNKTRTAFAMAETPAEPQAAVQETAQTLLRTGWTEQPGAATPAFKIFSSGGKICLLFAARNPQTGRTAISVLQREGTAP